MEPFVTRVKSRLLINLVPFVTPGPVAFNPVDWTCTSGLLQKKLFSVTTIMYFTQEYGEK